LVPTLARVRVVGHAGPTKWDILLFDEGCACWKATLDFREGGGANSGFGYSLGLGGDFSTNAVGELDTNLTQDEFGINANAGRNGNDWFNADYDSNAKSVTDTTDGYSTHHSESKSAAATFVARVSEPLRHECAGRKGCARKAKAARTRRTPNWGRRRPMARPRRERRRMGR
jgi:hypothetical protein